VFCALSNFQRFIIQSSHFSFVMVVHIVSFPKEEDDFDFEERMTEIKIELEGLNDEAVGLAKQVATSFKDLGL